MVRVKDLVDVGDKNYDKRQGEVMYCNNCDSEIGGTRGEIFMTDKEQVMTCPECGSDKISLVKKVTRYEVVKQ
jgi:Zn finger protein HypA/HybF involved in hydrogenase expression